MCSGPRWRIVAKCLTPLLEAHFIEWMPMTLPSGTITSAMWPYLPMENFAFMTLPPLEFTRAKERCGAPNAGLSPSAS